MERTILDSRLAYLRREAPPGKACRFWRGPKQGPGEAGKIYSWQAEDGQVCALVEGLAGVIIRGIRETHVEF